MKDLYTKIQRIQKEIGVMVKDNKVSFGSTKYSYFDINQVLEKLQPLLEKEKIVLTQPLDGDSLSTVIYDLESDEKLYSAIKLPSDVKPQDMGSAITYYRRYSIISLFALQTEDDDGAVAQGAKSPVKRNFAPNSTPTKGYTTVAEQKAYVAKNKADQEAGVSPF